jgi:hypothetical protein
MQKLQKQKFLSILQYRLDIDAVVAYLLLAENISGPLSIRLHRVHQPVIRTRNAFATLLPSLRADL